MPFTLWRMRCTTCKWTYAALIMGCVPRCFRWRATSTWTTCWTYRSPPTVTTSSITMKTGIHRQGNVVCNVDFASWNVRPITSNYFANSWIRGFFPQEISPTDDLSKWGNVLASTVIFALHMFNLSVCVWSLWSRYTLSVDIKKSRRKLSEMGYSYQTYIYM